MKTILEIACFSAEAAMVAANAGAQRIELCHNYCWGGVTPNYQTIIEVRQKVQLPLYAIIRPRGGNFRYNNQELAQMKNDIEFCKNAGLDGLVFGILKDDNTIDEEACETFINLAGNLPCTFHRAIDSCPDLDKAVQTLIKLGFKKVLSSGTASNAMEGAETLAALNLKYGKSITVIPGGGIRSGNLQKIITATSCTQFHSAALKPGSDLPNVNEIKKLLDVLKNN